MTPRFSDEIPADLIDVAAKAAWDKAGRPDIDIRPIRQAIRDGLDKQQALMLHALWYGRNGMTEDEVLRHPDILKAVGLPTHWRDYLNRYE